MIADDFTGATDVAVAFRRSGARVLLVLDLVRSTSLGPDAADVVVIARKTRTLPAAEAVAQTLEALDHLQAAGAGRYFLKYCSTFDSRDEGNIGPVADAVSARLRAPRTVFVPSSPEHGRTQVHGHLFVGHDLLSESPMRHHPLTPMTDSSIPRVLSRQTAHGVGLVDLHAVRSGPAAIRAALEDAATGGADYVVVDATAPSDLEAIGAAVAEDVLVTGAAGLASGLGAALARRRVEAGLPTPDADGDGAPDPASPGAALAGSCSARTLEQVAVMCSQHPHHFLDARTLADPERLAAEALNWFDAQDPQATPLLFSSQPPEELRRTQELLGTERASQILEAAVSLIARGLVDRGVQRLVVAGGETSGAVTTALEVASARIGDEVSTGVPWIFPDDRPGLALLLKSGNFGGPTLLHDALHSQETR
ncbi:3-oxo-tetronate kinase [Brachybacterium rhamnosum]|uniref:3-oxo-tetronate kinase n=1 Tax=Brachybacterium rhamnosum TaxID=173361 RepID=A0ABW4PWK2_9MICO